MYMDNAWQKFSKREQSALLFLVMTAVAGHLTLYLMQQTDTTIDELDSIVIV